MNPLNTLALPFQADNLLRASLLLIAGYFLSRMLSALCIRGLKHKIRPHQAMLIRRVIFFLTFMLFFASAMQQLNFRISALLGATGILTVALGIASQTSMSNLISGLFLIGEKPFEIGDNITLGTVSGEIISIDAMSVRIRTAENTMVRIPNETLIKSSFINLSFFPTRRINLPISIAYNEDISRTMRVLLDIAQKCSLCLSDPEPTVTIESFGDSAINMQLHVWVPQENRRDLQSMLYQSIKETFDREHITIPYPSRMLYTAASGLEQPSTLPKRPSQ